MHQASKICSTARLHFLLPICFSLHSPAWAVDTHTHAPRIKLTQIKACVSPLLLNSHSLPSRGICAQAAVLLLPWASKGCSSCYHNLSAANTITCCCSHVISWCGHSCSRYTNSRGVTLTELRLTLEWRQSLNPTDFGILHTFARKNINKNTHWKCSSSIRFWRKRCSLQMPGEVKSIILFLFFTFWKRITWLR